MYKVDLHTHSDASPDGGISFEQYVQLLDHQILDFIAVTDHNTIDRALELHQALGPKIIVGEEIMTLEGEIIGLFLKKPIVGGQPAADAIQAIKEQGGLVYLPHPFETIRSGLDKHSADALADHIDIVEVYNGRAFMQNRGPEAATWARLNRKVGAASSDAHGIKGVGSAYTSIQETPNAHNLVKLLATGQCAMDRPPLHSLLYPKAHRLLKKIRRKS